MGGVLYVSLCVSIPGILSECVRMCESICVFVCLYMHVYFLTLLACGVYVFEVPVS